MPETIRKAVLENQIQLLEKEIKSCQWNIDYHTECLEKSRMQLEAYRDLKRKLEEQNV